MIASDKPARFQPVEISLELPRLTVQRSAKFFRSCAARAQRKQNTAPQIAGQ